MLRAILNKSRRQHPTKQQLYGHLPLITKTIKIKRTRHAGYCWRSRDELIRDELLWTPLHGHAKARRPARTYIQQLCADTGCSPGDLPEAMDDREGWWERIRDIRADRATWWWWYVLMNIYIYIERERERERGIRGVIVTVVGNAHSDSSCVASCSFWGVTLYIYSCRSRDDASHY